MKKKIAVFAANDCKEEFRARYYTMAYETGKNLANAGFVTVTGGGEGLMNEVSRGAFENGGETIGIRLFLEGRIHSTFVTQKVLFHKLNTRQERLISLADGFLAVPGGIGTMYEIFGVMSLKRKGEIPMSKPLILIGKYFETIKTQTDAMKKFGFIYDRVDELYSLASNPKEAVDLLKKSY